MRFVSGQKGEWQSKPLSAYEKYGGRPLWDTGYRLSIKGIQMSFYLGVVGT
jgi:hypothetical protein